LVFKNQKKTKKKLEEIKKNLGAGGGERKGALIKRKFPFSLFPPSSQYFFILISLFHRGCGAVWGKSMCVATWIFDGEHLLSACSNSA